jgi:riboflavin kinase, archaea type
MLRGVVKSGVGEGAFFMGLKPYQKAMRILLGYKPYKGTLNLGCKKEEVEAFIKGLDKITIQGFRMGTKGFGEVHCYPCSIKKEKCAIAIPQFTRYDLSTVEIISKRHLRTALELKEGDEVFISR